MLGKYTTPFRRISFLRDASPSFLPRVGSAGGGESPRRDLLLEQQRLHRRVRHVFGSVSHIDILFSCSNYTPDRHLLIAFQTLFGAPALSSLAIHAIVIDVCFRISAANSIFSGSPFLRVFKNCRRSSSSKEIASCRPPPAHHTINRSRVFQPQLPCHYKTLSKLKNMTICGTEPFYRAQMLGRAR